MSSSTLQWTGQANNMKLKADVVMGDAAATANTGTKIDGNNISILLATANPENLSMQYKGKTVESSIKSYIAENPTAADHQEQFTNMIAEAQSDYIRERQGKTFKDGNQTISYDVSKDMSGIYSGLTNALGEPDKLPQTKETLAIRSASTQSIEGVSSLSNTPNIDRAVNPYENFYNLAGDKRRTYQQTIGGSDLSVFYMAEYPNMEDVILQVPPDLQRKELVIFELDSALSISYSILRERFPVRTLGRANPVTFTRGSRTIAGHIAFAVFAEDVLSRLRSRIRNKFDEIKNKFESFAQGNDNTKTSMRAYDDRMSFEKMRYFYEAAFQYDKVQLLDSLPPFHLLIMGVNEAGLWSKFIIKNISIVDENQYQGTQQPNIVNKVSWVATDIVPMASFKMKPYTVVDSLNSIDEAYQNGTLNLTSNYNLLSGSNILESIKEDLAKDTINSPKDTLYHDPNDPKWRTE